jgi:hypothetical protein
MLMIKKKYTSSYTIFLSCNLISWKSSKQHTISFSSIKAEYKNIAKAIVKLKRVRSLFHELGIFKTSTWELLFCTPIQIPMLIWNMLRIVFYFTHDMVMIILRIYSLKSLSLSWFTLLQFKLNVVLSSLNLWRSIKAISSNIIPGQCLPIYFIISLVSIFLEYYYT